MAYLPQRPGRGLRKTLGFVGQLAPGPPPTTRLPSLPVAFYLVYRRRADKGSPASNFAVTYPHPLVKIRSPPTRQPRIPWIDPTRVTPWPGWGPPGTLDLGQTGGGLGVGFGGSRRSGLGVPPPPRMVWPTLKFDPQNCPKTDPKKWPIQPCFFFQIFWFF
jgi:hypothetical protein